MARSRPMSESYPLPYVSNDLTGPRRLRDRRQLRPRAALRARRWPRPAPRSRPPPAASTSSRSWPRRSPANGGECVPIALDVTDAESITQAVAHANEALGLVDILVNNAGIPDAQRAHKMSLELTDAVLDTNLRGPWLLANEVARGLLAAEQPGRIVNIASIGAFNYGGNGAALYSISKTAIHRMTEVLAVEWSRFNINVNCIAPGRLRLRDDGRDAEPDGRHHPALPAQAAARPGPARLDAAVPRVAGVRGRHRHDDQGRRRSGSRSRFRPERGYAARRDSDRGRRPRSASSDRPTRRALEDALFLAGIEAAWTDVPKAKKAKKAAAKAVEPTAPTSSSRAAATAPSGPRPRRSSAPTPRSPCSRPAPPTSSPAASSCRRSPPTSSPSSSPARRRHDRQRRSATTARST